MANQEFNVYFENLIAFGLAPKKSRTPDPFLQSCQNGKMDIFLYIWEGF